MITRVDSVLVEEAARFALSFTCDRCAHFDPERRTCANGYPAEPHRDVTLEVGGEVLFCKEFELL